LKALEKTCVVRVPKPLKVFSVGNTTLLVTELLNFTSLDNFQGELGKQLAK
jgi:fructosamine-3-kinase